MEPFLVVGLIASIRRILVITLEAALHGSISSVEDETFRASLPELVVFGLLILVMVVSIFLLRGARQPEHDEPHLMEAVSRR